MSQLDIFTEQEQMTTGAIFDEERTHRYILFRIWDDKKPYLMVIGLNPSRANETKSDNTITKLIKIAKYNGFGGFYMANLFSYVSTDPEKLIQCIDNSKNDLFLKEYASKSDAICFAWGNFKQAAERSKEVIAMFPNAYCLFMNKNGSPKHPLYCEDKTKLIKFIYPCNISK